MKNDIAMGRLIWFLALVLLAVPAFAQNEKKAAAGLGLEWNMNSRRNFAGGAVLAFDYNLPHFFAAGLTVKGSHNFSDTGVLEGSALLRRYFPGKDYTGFFAQIDAGLHYIMEDGETYLLPLAGLWGGYRLPLGNNFYIEPYGRIGYPFAFGMGVIGGVRF